MQKPETGSVYLKALLVALAMLYVGDRNASAQLSLPSLPGGMGQLPVDRGLGDRLDSRVRRTTEEVEPLVDAVEETVSGAVEQIDETGERLLETASGVLRVFVPETDAAGAPIEADIIMAVADAEQRVLVEQAGYRILARRTLPSLGLTMLTLERPATLSMVAALDALRTSVPGIRADFNHVYRGTADTTKVAASDAPELSSAAPDGDEQRLRIGVIDSDVLPEHPALRKVVVTRKDFVTHEALRPQTHGTAVSSLIARSAGDNVSIYSASVFFQAGNYAPGATTESLVAALDWLASEQVDVINMSLAGPGNDLLELAVGQLRDTGPLIVAAVGNNGPASEPLYPAAYEGTIGVTAVDRDGRIFRYANRGDYVDCAATGVNVKVADSTTGGWRIESGTSMASPFIAVWVARLLREQAVPRAAVITQLVASAKDLGRNGYDTTYGHGLISELPAVVSAN